MSAYGGSKIVTDGLLVYLDASDNQSYSTGAILHNLVNSDNNFINYNGAGISGSAASKRIVFDGVNDIAQYVGTPTGLQGDPDFTVFGAFYRTGDMINEACWGFGTGATLDGIGSYNGGTPNDIALDLWGNSTITTGDDFPLNSWVLVHWVKTAGALNPTNLTIWINDRKETGTSLTQIRGGSSIPTIGSQGMILGRIGYTVSSYYAPVDIGLIAFYDRVLTDKEIAQNYISSRGRFGL